MSASKLVSGLFRRNKHKRANARSLWDSLRGRSVDLFSASDSTLATRTSDCDRKSLSHTSSSLHKSTLYETAIEDSVEATDSEPATGNDDDDDPDAEEKEEPSYESNEIEVVTALTGRIAKYGSIGEPGGGLSPPPDEATAKILLIEFLVHNHRYICREVFDMIIPLPAADIQLNEIRSETVPARFKVEQPDVVKAAASSLKRIIMCFCHDSAHFCDALTQHREVIESIIITAPQGSSSWHWCMQFVKPLFGFDHYANSHAVGAFDLGCWLFRKATKSSQDTGNAQFGAIPANIVAYLIEYSKDDDPQRRDFHTQCSLIAFETALYILSYRRFQEDIFIYLVDTRVDVGDRYYASNATTFRQRRAEYLERVYWRACEDQEHESTLEHIAHEIAQSRAGEHDEGVLKRLDQELKARVCTA